MFFRQLNETDNTDIKTAKKSVSTFRSFTLERVDRMIETLREAPLQLQAAWLKSTLDSLVLIDQQQPEDTENSWFKSGKKELIKLYKYFVADEQKYNYRLFFKYCPPYEEINAEDQKAIRTIFKFKLSSRLDKLQIRLSLPTSNDIENPKSEDELLASYNKKNETTIFTTYTSSRKYMALSLLFFIGTILEVALDTNDDRKKPYVFTLLALSLLSSIKGMFTLLVHEIFEGNLEHYYHHKELNFDEAHHERQDEERSLSL